MAENKWTLTGADTHHSTTDFTVTASDFGRSQPAFSVHRRTLHGGLREGVEVVEIDNGRFRFSVLPTRGMSIWKGWLGDTEIGWQSPVRGPVHPQFVPIAEPSGLGFLDGFDEWIVRCGLVSNGAPEFDPEGRLKYPLHGRIANLPASHVELEIDVEREEIRLTGIVEETRFLVRQLQLRSTVVTRFGEPGLSLHDEVVNLAAPAAEMQLLYHINFGLPLLGPGATFVAPVKTLVPRNARSAEGLESWQTYGPPQAGFAEQVYFAELADVDHQSRVLLKNAGGDLGASLAFDRRQLPCFTLWKNTGALVDGYVTGLEPATNFPNPRSFEGKQGRVIKLPAGGRAQFDLTVALHDGSASVSQAEREIEALRAVGAAKIFSSPQHGWTIVDG